MLQVLIIFFTLINHLHIRNENNNKKIYNCACGAGFATLKEVDKYNLEAY